MISILCSVYNSSANLDNYLRYLNDQFLQEFEVVFVDAHSTDDSLKKIKEFKFRGGITTIVIECGSRLGVYEAWNLAIENCSNDYVMNYNTDDKLYRNALLTATIYCNLYPHMDVIYSNCHITSDSNHQQYSGWYLWADANSKAQLLAGCCVGPFPVVKKSSLVKYGMFDPSFTISGDYEMWSRMRSKGAKFYKMTEFLGAYYNNPEGVSTKNTPERWELHVMQDTRIRELYA